VSLLDSGSSHRFRAKKKYGLLTQLDPAFVDRKVNAHCGELMARYFPELRSVADVSHRLQADTPEQ
jgi:hypothetical protein